MSTRYRFVGPVSYEYMIANLPEGISAGNAEGELEGDFRYLTDGKNFLHFSISPRYLDKGSSVCGFTSYGDDIHVHGIISRLEEKYGVEIMSEHVENLIISQVVAEYDSDKQAGLDDLIDGIKSREASDLNNGGSELQIRFLIEKMGVKLATEAVRILNEIPSPLRGVTLAERLNADGIDPHALGCVSRPHPEGAKRGGFVPVHEEGGEVVFYDSCSCEWYDYSDVEVEPY